MPFLACVFFAVALTGCQALYFLTPEEHKDVKAEYGKIGSRRVAVVVWADRPTMDLYPRARRRVCDAVVWEMKKHLPKAGFVKCEKVEDLQERSGIDWEAMSQSEICKHLSCDLAIRIDLMEYTTRAADTRELRKGRLSATVNLYQPDSEGREDAVYTTDVVATYPPTSEPSVTEKSDGDLLRAATELFAQDVVKKFYDHQVTLRGRDAG